MNDEARTDKEAKGEACAGDTPLHRAVRFGHVEVVQLLISRGANPSTGNFDGQTPLHLAAEQGGLAILQLLLEVDVPLDIHDNSGAAATHLAAANGHAGALALLLDRGANVDRVSGVRRAGSDASSQGCGNEADRMLHAYYR